MRNEPFTVREVARQLEELGVERGGVLLVHTSFRHVRPVAGGPSGLIEALRVALGPEGTLVMPAMTDGESVFDPRSTPTMDMGITAETFRQMDGVLRSMHPSGSFAAAGPHAERICAPQPLAPPHGRDSPPGRVRDLDGRVLLLGVTHGESTMLHVAEDVAQVPYAIEYPCVVGVDAEGTPITKMIAETDHCCRGFARMDEWLGAQGLQREGEVGNAVAKLARARDVVDVAVARLTEDPLVFLCPPSARCEECDRALGR